MTATTATPTREELDDVLLSSRYGEVDEIRVFGDKFGWECIADARDDRGNTVLHMACGNGHLDTLKVLLEHVPALLLTMANDAGSPPIHWAVLNNHVSCVQALVDVPEELGGGIALLKQKNGAGRDAFAESIFAGEGKEEVSGWIEGYLWRVEGGDDEDGEIVVKAGDLGEGVEAGDEDKLAEKVEGVSV